MPTQGQKQRKQELENQLLDSRLFAEYGLTCKELGERMRLAPKKARELFSEYEHMRQMHESTTATAVTKTADQKAYAEKLRQCGESLSEARKNWSNKVALNIESAREMIAAGNAHFEFDPRKSTPRAAGEKEKTTADKLKMLFFAYLQVCHSLSKTDIGARISEALIGKAAAAPTAATEDSSSLQQTWDCYAKWASKNLEWLANAGQEQIHELATQVAGVVDEVVPRLTAVATSAAIGGMVSRSKGGAVAGAAAAIVASANPVDAAPTEVISDEALEEYMRKFRLAHPGELVSLEPLKSRFKTINGKLVIGKSNDQGSVHFNGRDFRNLNSEEVIFGDNPKRQKVYFYDCNISGSSLQGAFETIFLMNCVADDVRWRVTANTFLIDYYSEAETSEIHSSLTNNNFAGSTLHTFISLGAVDFTHSSFQNATLGSKPNFSKYQLAINLDLNGARIANTNEIISGWTPMPKNIRTVSDHSAPSELRGSGSVGRGKDSDLDPAAILGITALSALVAGLAAATAINVLCRRRAPIAIEPQAVPVPAWGPNDPEAGGVQDHPTQEEGSAAAGIWPLHGSAPIAPAPQADDAIPATGGETSAPQTSLVEASAKAALAAIEEFYRRNASVAPAPQAAIEEDGKDQAPQTSPESVRVEFVDEEGREEEETKSTGSRR